MAAVGVLVDGDVLVWAAAIVASGSSSAPLRSAIRVI